jgi:hypothetical protein
MTDSIKVKYLNSTDCTPVQSNQAKKERKKKKNKQWEKRKRTLFKNFISIRYSIQSQIFVDRQLAAIFYHDYYFIVPQAHRYTN